MRQWRMWSVEKNGMQMLQGLDMLYLIKMVQGSDMSYVIIRDPKSSMQIYSRRS